MAGKPTGKPSSDGQRAGKAPSVAAPSASVVVISPQNKILLLHRVQTGTFSSAHVFPGGNLSAFHEGPQVPAVDSPDRHVDGPAYRLAAVRETFEESGVLLARLADSADSADTKLLQLPESVAAPARQRVALDEVRFTDWLASVGGVADTARLVPFTRWITPPSLARRYTTQMYLYLLPQVGAPPAAATADLAEVQTAEYATAADWLERARRSDVLLFPPQVYILTLLAPVLRGPAGRPPGADAVAHYAAERQALHRLIQHGVDGVDDADGPAAWVPWADKVISPRPMAKLPAPDGRAVLALDQPGPELRALGRIGDLHRVVLAGNMPPGPPRDVEVRLRSELPTDGARL